MTNSYLTQMFRFSSWLVAVAAGCAAMWILWLSRYQPVEWDLAMLHYSAFLINERGFILYRDIFENNLPGTFLFHVILGKTVGYEAFPLRLVDFSILGGLAIASWKIISPISRQAAILAPSLFVGIYLYTGTTVALQRDYIGILPIVTAIFLVGYKKVSPVTSVLLLGALCGLACGFKPNYIILFPALYGLFIRENSQLKTAEKYQLFIVMGLSFTSIFAIPFIWGMFKGDYSSFVYIYKTFTPIYLQSRIDLYHFDSPQEQLTTLINNQIKHMMYCFLTATPGLVWAWHQTDPGSTKRNLVIRIGITTCVFSFYELMAGKYWLAHLLPSYFWNTVCFSLLLTPPKKLTAPLHWGSTTLTIVIVATLSHFVLSSTIQQTTSLGYTKSNEHIRSQRIARYLKNNLRPEDTVQGIDGSGDGQGSLLLAGATVATRYLEDIPLYMQPDTPATQAFRKEFLTALNKKKPAYIVYIHNIFHPAGGNRLKEFHALDQFIQNYYEIAVLDEGEYTIYRRKNL